MAFISRFQLAIRHLQSIILPYVNAIRSPLTGLDMEAIDSRTRTSQRMFKLLSNGMRWRKYAKTLILPAGGEGDGVGAGTTWETCLARELVGKAMLPVIDAGWETGGSILAAKVSLRPVKWELPAEDSFKRNRSLSCFRRIRSTRTLRGDCSVNRIPLCGSPSES